MHWFVTRFMCAYTHIGIRAVVRTSCIGLSRYIAIANVSIIAVFVEYLRQFLIDLNQIYRHSSVPYLLYDLLYDCILSICFIKVMMMMMMPKNTSP